MGLFGGLGKIFKAVAPIVGTALGGPLGGALGGAASALLGGSSDNKAIAGQNNALQLGLTNAENTLNTQFAGTTANFQPNIDAGHQALGQEGDLLGLNGNATQGSAISALQASPLFQTMFNTGRDSILAAGSATGGLRGGNVNQALYNSGQQTLAQVIQQQLTNLGGLSSQGLSAAGTLGGLGAQNASSIADLLVGSGKANAGAIAGQQASNNATQNGVNSAFGGSGVQDQITKLLQGLMGGGGSGGGNGDALSGLPALSPLNTTPNTNITGLGF